jgi:hypothetical protein
MRIFGLWLQAAASEAGNGFRCELAGLSSFWPDLSRSRKVPRPSPGHRTRAIVPVSKGRCDVETMHSLSRNNWIAGCQAAREHLDPVDALRRSDAD